MDSYSVYAHISPSGKYYIGITSQKNIKKRWRNGNGYKDNKYFCRAIDKYGWDNFQHEIIASDITKEEAINFEILLISKLQSNKKEYGYNITAGGEGCPGVKFSEESKKKMSKKQKGKIISEETRAKISKGKKKRINQVDIKTNEIIRIWDSAIDIEAEMGFNHPSIAHVATGRQKTAYGYIWRYTDVC